MLYSVDTNSRESKANTKAPGNLGRKARVPLSKETKAEVIGNHRIHETDTGSADVQVAVLTARIRQLQTHLSANKQDNHSRRGLLMMVGKRKRLLSYLARSDHERYKELIGRLGLRR
jgi:small subunit ribosomal protein S15